MKEITYNDGLCTGSRRPCLWIAHKGVIHTFDGSTIPGVAVVVGESYEKKGKWSNTTYTILIPNEAEVYELLAPLHGRVWSQATRHEAYRDITSHGRGVFTFEEFDKALERNFPHTRARMIATEEAIMELEEADQSGGEWEIVEVSTLQPCRREPHQDIRVKAPGGKTWVVAWDAPNYETEIPGVMRFLDSKRYPGYRGGTKTQRIAVALGVRVSPYSYGKDEDPHEWALGRQGNGIDPVILDAEAQKEAEEKARKEGRTAMGEALRKAGLIPPDKN